MRRVTLPDNELPSGVALSVLLARTDDVAIGVTAAEAYTTGLAFRLVVLTRRSALDLVGHRLQELIDGWGGRSRSSIGERLHFGVEFSDGRRASNLPGRPQAFRERDEDPDQPLLVPQGSGGGDRLFHQDFWLTPVPPRGPLAFVCAWPAVGILETRTTVDGTLIGAASARSRVLWPWEPPERRPPPRAEPPASTGWVAATPSANPGDGPAGRSAR